MEACGNKKPTVRCIRWLILRKSSTTGIGVRYLIGETFVYTLSPKEANREAFSKQKTL
jgi:hypothetical protein